VARNLLSDQLAKAAARVVNRREPLRVEQLGPSDWQLESKRRKRADAKRRKGQTWQERYPGSVHTNYRPSDPHYGKVAASCCGCHPDAHDDRGGCLACECKTTHHELAVKGELRVPNAETYTAIAAETGRITNKRREGKRA